MPHAAQEKMTLLCMVCCHDATWWRRGCENENGSKNMVWRARSFVMKVWSYKQRWRRNRPSHSTAGQLCAWGLTWLSVPAAEAHIGRVEQGRTDRQGLTEQAGVDMGEANAVPAFTSSLPSSVLPGPAIYVQTHPVCHCPLLQTRGIFTSTAPCPASDAAFVLIPFWGLLCCPI